MSYENAPATILLATHCCICGRPLGDAQSVERGIGPDCAKKYGAFLASLDEATRISANQLTHKLALLRKEHKGGADVGFDMAEVLKQLHTLGLTVLARKAAEGVADVEISRDDEHDALCVSWSFVAGERGALLYSTVKSLKGKWLAKQKSWLVPAENAKGLNGLLVKFFEGKIALGPKGPFLIGY